MADIAGVQHELGRHGQGVDFGDAAFSVAITSEFAGLLNPM